MNLDLFQQMEITTHHIEISKAIALCTSNNISVVSVKVGNKYAVKVVVNGKEKVFDKSVYAHQIHSAIKKTWRYYAAKILNNELLMD